MLSDIWSAVTSTSDAVTFWVYLFGLWIVYGLRELQLGLARKEWQPADGGTRPRLISPVSRDYGWKMNALVYTYCAMATHWWWSAEWGATWAGFVFWALIGVLLIWDVIEWPNTLDDWPVWKRYARWPVLWGAIGLAAGRFLFPQAGRVPWDWTP